MTTPQIALFSLFVGVVIGAGVVLLIVAAYRVRARVQEEASTTVPSGIVDVLANLDDAACVVDPSGLIVAASPPAARLGMTTGSVLEIEQLRRLVRAVRTTGSPESRTMRIARTGSTLDPRLVHARAGAVGARLVLVVVRDATEQERLDQMRRDFVANTSHELKTPVGAVTLLAEAIESAADDPEQVRLFAARISAEATRLSRLTGRIMNLSRLQSADGVSDVRPVSIDEVVKASIEAHAVAADDAGVALVPGGDRGAWVRGDVQILVEAVGNLIANAIVYSPRGSRVGVGVKVDGEVVEIAVTDQGIGISEAEQERIFERFYRADEARSRRTGGTGLGLSIVKHATQRHGGEVKLWSRPGQGSTFTIRLPRIEAPSKGGKSTKKRVRKARARTGDDV